MTYFGTAIVLLKAGSHELRKRKGECRLRLRLRRTCEPANTQIIGCTELNFVKKKFNFVQCWNPLRSPYFSISTFFPHIS